MPTFIKLPGYVLDLDSVTCVSSIEQVERPNEKDKNKIETFHHVSVFFDGNRLEWFFQHHEEAEMVRNRILKDWTKGQFLE